MSEDMPEIKSKFFSVSVPSVTDITDEATKSKYMTKKRLELIYWVVKHKRCKGFYKNKTDDNTVFIEFDEPKIPSNLRTLIPEYQTKRLTEEEFCEATKDVPNLCKEHIESEENDIGDIRVYDKKTIATDSSGNILRTFTVETQKKYLNEFQGMVSKITFDNPENKKITAVINMLDTHIYKETTGNCIDFTIDETSNNLTPGQIMQTFAANEYFMKETKEKFSTFCEGKIHKYYFDLAHLREFDLIGLSDDSRIRLEFFTLKRAYPWDSSKTAELWVTYCFSI